MSLASISIKRPSFITSVVILMLGLGIAAMFKLGVDLFPNVTFPYIMVVTAYPGAGPNEIETQVSKIIEDELSSLAGVKSVSSISKEGVSIVSTEFSLETDVKVAEQQVRDRVSAAKVKLPRDIKEPVIRRLDPGDQPVLVIALRADLKPAEKYDFANEVLRPQFEQINKVGKVEILGGRKREIQIQLDKDKLKKAEISATQVASRIAATGQNVPAGKVENQTKETIFRTLGEYKVVDEISKTIVSLLGNDVPVTVAQLGEVQDTLQDEKSRSYVNGESALTIMVYRQSGANTVSVVKDVVKKMNKLNEIYAKYPGEPKLKVVRDTSKMISANVQDVNESILIGIFLTVVVVYFFLGSMRSTLITGLALPNSLLGAFVLMYLAGFTINIMTLLALSLAVGLLIDDAIVVRENIFRHMEMGKTAMQASLDGTHEVTLAVLATTLTVLAVFGPIGFLQGVVGQFFKEFGLTVCFAMIISLFDALTIAPMLSTYFAAKGGAHQEHSKSGFMGKVLTKFDQFQTKVEDSYVSLLKKVLNRPLLTLGIALVIFILSLGSTAFINKTFLPAQDNGEFVIHLDMAPGTTLQEMDEVTQKIDAKLRSHKEVNGSLVTVGSNDGESNLSEFYVTLVPLKQRNVNTSEFKAMIREDLKEYVKANPKVGDVDIVSGGLRPFTLRIVGTDLDLIKEVSDKVYAKLKNHPALTDVDTSFRPGKPELQIKIDDMKAQQLGVSSASLGMELRTRIEGATPAVFRENGREYDIRVRMRNDQRNLAETFEETMVPNINYTMVRLPDLAKPVKTFGPANINRQDRGRYIQIVADIAPNGPGMGGAIQDVKKMFETEIKLPQGVSYRFVGQAENFQELVINMLVAVLAGTFFIYLVLVSLYESFVTPFTIMLVLPLAACGAFFALLLTRHSLDLFSMIGCIMLLGVATKNSILLVDYTKQKEAEGVSTFDAILAAGKTRLRPILMTSFALIAGMLPIAIGLNEASRQRTSMGVAIIGGLVSSTLLTLVVIPAAYTYIENFRLWSQKRLQKLIGQG